MDSVISFLIPKSYSLCCISSLSSVQNRSLSYFSSSSPASSSSLLWKTKAHFNPTKPFSLLPVCVASSSSKKVGAVENLKRVLDSEIKRAKDLDDLDQGLPDLSPFEIFDDLRRRSSIHLNRKFPGESINVDICIDEESQHPQSHVSLSIYKKGLFLSIRCTAYSAAIVIDSIVMWNSEDRVFIAPKFSDLDENLQKAFYQYLEVRGITNPLAISLQEYIVKSNNMEYLMCLKNMKDFVSA